MTSAIQEEIDTERREMNVWICSCECWTAELDSEVDNVRCGNCGNQDVRIKRTFLYDREIEEAA